MSSNFILRDEEELKTNFVTSTRDPLGWPVPVATAASLKLWIVMGEVETYKEGGWMNPDGICP